MPSERGTQAAVGVVLAFSLLWVVAVSIPDGSQQNLRLNVNGRQYTFEASRKLSRKKGAARVLRSLPYSSSELKRMVSLGKVGSLPYAPPNAPFKNMAAASQRRASSSGTQSNPDEASQQSSSKTTDSSSSSSGGSGSGETKKDRAPLFPRYMWFGFLAVFHARNLIERRRKRMKVEYEEDWFARSGLQNRLEYGTPEYEDDFLSVDRSFYGTMLNEYDKFDMDGELEWEEASDEGEEQNLLDLSVEI